MKLGAFFEWDEQKAARNIELGRPAFEDVYRFRFATAVIFEDDRKDYGETRMTALGFVDDRIHVLTYTTRGDRLRVISFRHANPREIARHDGETLDRNRDGSDA